jgi:hypothetical protein
MGAFLVLGIGGAVEAAASEAQPYRYLAVVAGDCEQLVLAGRDRTAGCGDKLVNIDFGNGRVGFVFMSPSERGAVVTAFLGRSSVQPDLRTYRLDVDEISTTTTGAANQPENVVDPAEGHCAMIGDPTRERARFECTVERGSVRTAATFLSAGTPTVYAGDRSEEGGAPAALAANPTPAR